jgi:hypothetical protein
MTKQTSADRKLEKANAEDEAKTRKSVVPAAYKAQYKERGDATSCGDNVASKLKAAILDKKAGGMSLAKLAKIGKLNDVDVAEKWGHLNPGMRRMNLGNVLRAKAKRGEKVVWK